MKASQLSQFKESPLQGEFENIYNILNKISFGQSFSNRAENLDMYLATVTANSVASNDTSISHDLKRTPSGYLILSQSASGNFYNGSGTNTSTNFFIKCTTASTIFKIALI